MAATTRLVSGALAAFLLMSGVPGRAGEIGIRSPQTADQAGPMAVTNGTNTPAALTFLEQNHGILTATQRTNLLQQIAAGTNLEKKDSDGRTALTHAVLRGDLETVRVLVEAGANVKARDRFHKTPLLYAVEAGRRDIVDFLASNGDLQSPTPRERKERQRR